MEYVAYFKLSFESWGCSEVIKRDQKILNMDATDADGISLQLYLI